jgi:hypothetical protein
VEALEATGAKVQCPSCERRDWRVIPPEHLRHIEIEGMAQPIKLVTAWCLACGFVRTHTEHELLEALAGNRPNLTE